VITTATEQKFARGFDVIVEDLPRLLRQLKSNLTRPTGLLLPHCGAIDRMPAWPQRWLLADAAIGTEQSIQ
jgi:hypothetical protein